MTLLFVLLCLPAQAADTDKPLDEDEGWLLLVVDNGSTAQSLHLDGPSVFGDRVKGLIQGRSVSLLRARAGKYRWSSVTAGRLQWNLRRGTDREFSVEAGKVNYPGNFVLEGRGGLVGMFYRSNRALQAMMAMDSVFPGVRGKYPWRQDLGSPDPFPEFASGRFAPDKTAALMAAADADAKKIRAGQVDQHFSDVFSELYAPPRAQWPRLNPSGNLLAYKERVDGGEVAVVVDLVSGERVELLGVTGQVAQLLWAGERAIYVRMAVDINQMLAGVKGKTLKVPMSQQNGVELIRLGEGKLDSGRLSRVRIPGSVAVLNPLLYDDKRGLLLRADSEGEVHVFAFDETSKSYEVKEFRNDKRLDKGLEKVVAMFVDASGNLRAALVGTEGGDLALAVRDAEGKWQQRPPLPENIYFDAVALSQDGSHVIVLTDSGREQVEMVKLNLDSGALGETILAEPGADLTGALQRSRDGAVVGAQFFRNGSLQTRRLPGYQSLLPEAIAAKLPNYTLVDVDSSFDERRVVLIAASETDPGSYYLYDRGQRTLEKLFDFKDPFKHTKVSDSKVFSVRTGDGLDVQGFLTLPQAAAGARSPLVVMPHGGPIGVSDQRYFDASVQMLANSGFAVLRVNYRGSGGAGKAFADAGHGKWGREIEADIDLALEHALKNFPLDRERIALWGASYGGYSTLMNLIDRPEKYRCGVAVAPVTDLALMFSSSDWARSEDAVKEMKRIVGDPDTQMAELRQYSPVYQYERLKKPLLLIHGTEDRRVSFEHSWRLRQLLAAAGRAPALLPLPGADHSVSRLADTLAMHAASDAFLRECTAPAAAAAP